MLNNNPLNVFFDGKLLRLIIYDGNGQVLMICSSLGGLSKTKPSIVFVIVILLVFYSHIDFTQNYL